MDNLFNKELFDKLSTSQVEKIIRQADNTALEKMGFLYELIQRFRNVEAGFEVDESLPKKKVIAPKNYEKSFKMPDKSLFNEKLFDSLSTKQIYSLIQESPRNLLKRIRELGGFANDELDERLGTELIEEKSLGCTKLDRFRGNWIEDLTCGEFEERDGFLIFRPNKDLILYHASDSFTTGDPFDDPIWLGSYDNSVTYVGEGGHMNIFRIKRSPKLIVLTDDDNIEKVLGVSTPKERKIISRATGIGKSYLSVPNRKFGCVYKQKPRKKFSRYSSRAEDMVMAKAICAIPGIDGYIQPQVNYCSSGLAYRDGEPLPSGKRFWGEVVMCGASKFLERVVDPALECVAGEPCDLTRKMWKREFEDSVEK